MTRNKYYILDGYKAVRAGASRWARWSETADRAVDSTQVGTGRVSTVFLGLNQNFDDGPPLLFETMVFGGTLDGEMERYTTWGEAQQGHARMVERLRKEDG